MFERNGNSENLIQNFSLLIEKHSILFLNVIILYLLSFCIYMCHKEIYPFVNKSKAITFAIIVSLANNISFVHDSQFINFRFISQILVLSSYYYSLKNQHYIGSLVSKERKHYIIIIIIII